MSSDSDAYDPHEDEAYRRTPTEELPVMDAATAYMFRSIERIDARTERMDRRLDSQSRSIQKRESDIARIMEKQTQMSAKIDEVDQRTKYVALATWAAGIAITAGIVGVVNWMIGP